MKNYTKDFSELNKSNADIAGGKGASLGEMMQAGIPVPDGFVVLSTTFDHFLHETDLTQEIDSILTTVDHKEMHTVESASEKIQGLIKNVQMPESIAEEIKKQFKGLDTEYVAVRSSATAEDGQEHAWAGQLDSFLNTTEKDLLEKVQRCWASLFTPRAIFYRFEKGLHTTQISVAVVVQKMVNSEISGIAFSVHPVTEDRNQLIIEAGFGLGEAIVSGQVTPDSYVVEKEPRNILDINISTQLRGLYRVSNGGNEWLDIIESKASSQVLDKTQILKLSEIIIGIENHYGFPCDIEWAYEQGKFFVVQSRPITTILKSGTVSQENNFKRWLIQNKLDFLYKANYDLFTIDLYYQTSLLNKSLIGSQDTDYVILSEKGEAAAYYPVKQEDKSKLFNENLLKEVFERSKSARGKYQTFSKKYINADANNLNLAEFFDDYCSIYIDLVACFRTTRPVYVDALVGSLKERLSVTGAGQEVLSYLLISENADDIRLEQIDWTSLLKKGSATADDFKRHAIRYPWLFPSIYNYEIAIKKLVDRYTADLINLGDKLKESEDIQNGLEKNLNLKKKYLADCSEKEIHRLSKVITELSEFRTYFKLTLSGITFTFREILKGIALNANLKPDFFYNSYTIEDIKKLLVNKEPLSPSVVNQRNEYYIYIVKNLKNEIKSDKEYLTIIKDHFSSDKKSYVLGASASMGIVTGIARVLSNSEVKNLTEESLKGKILVTTMTDPSIMPFIRNCLAFVTDEGGLTSHAAIVSRELNIPCIVGTKNGTQAIKDGSLIEVNANTGIVNILKTQ